MRKIVERSLREAGIDLTQVLEAGNGAGCPHHSEHKANPEWRISVNCRQPGIGLRQLADPRILRVELGVPTRGFTTNYMS
jgi:hypothetical protein